MNWRNKLKELKLELPEVNPPLANYSPLVITGNTIMTSGQLPMKDGELLYTGKLGADISIDDAYEAAKICALNNLANIEKLAGGLDNIKRIVKVTCYVASAPDFYDQAKVANGVTDLTVTLFGEAGKAARSAFGVAALPLNAPVEVDMLVELK